MCRGPLEEHSPCRYPVIGSLAAHLELEPLIELMLLLECIVREDLFNVILLYNVLHDGTGFPQSNVCIWVFDSWDPAIWVDVGEGLLLDIGKTHNFELVGHA